MNGFMSSHQGQWRTGFKLVSLVTTLAFATITFTACMSTTVMKAPAQDIRAPSVKVDIYERPKDARQGNPTVPGVVTELFFYKAGRWELIRRESSGSWSMYNLLPGKYKAIARYRVKANGEREELGGDNQEVFTLVQGQDAGVRFFVEHIPAVAVVFMAITIIFLVFLLIYFSEGQNSGHHHVDFAPPPVDLMFMWAFEFPPLVMYPDYNGWNVQLVVPPFAFGWEGGPGPRPYFARDNQAPEIVNHWPQHGSEGVPTNAEIKFQLNRLISSESLDHRWIVVTDEQGERIMGGIYYLPQSSLCVYDPIHPLPPDQKITVTVYGDKITDEQNTPLAESYQWSFTTAAQ